MTSENRNGGPFQLSGARRRTAVGLISITAVLLSFWGSNAAGAVTPNSGLRWLAPKSVASGVPVSVASVKPCPPVPTPGDTTLVGFFLSFGAGGVSGVVAPVHSDGSWAATVTFNFNLPGIRRATISASCLDYTGHGALPYAEYKTKHTRIT